MSAALSINALGEVFVDDTYVLGSINVADLRERLGVTRMPTKREVKAEFKRLARERLTKEQFAAYTHHGRLLNLGTALVRFNTKAVHGRARHTLTIEFLALVSDRTTWKRIYELASMFDAEVVTLTCEKNRDRSRLLNKVTHKPIGPWEYGPHYGKVERQVALDVDVTGKSIAEVRSMRDRIVRTARKLKLSSATVAVI